MEQTILDTDNDNVKLVLRATNGNLETIRQITASTGEISQENGDTIETITITRTLLTSTANS
ncbi:hypothetical protein [Flavobacterium sp. 25HG05S-40]|uniref:hypothetical protein n=1 Tax=Flavobacterium sp. 25HG05S-40 TaxID=3458682 RepID=UPI0040444E13